MEKGLTYTSKTIVNENNTAIAMGSGDLEVFATPALVALMENAAKQAVETSLPEGATTVGAYIQTSHIKTFCNRRRSDSYGYTRRNRR